MLVLVALSDVSGREEDLPGKYNGVESLACFVERRRCE